ncbi:dodecin family protein [Thiobacillus sp.]
MSIAKTIEITAESTDSFEEAVRQGIVTTARTVRNIHGAWVKEQSVVVDAGKITRFRVDLKITFIVD